MLPVVRQWSVVVVFLLWPVVAVGQPPTNTTYEIPPPEYAIPSPWGDPRLEADYPDHGGFRYFQGVLEEETPNLANTIKLLTERRRLKLVKLADKAGEFRQLLRGKDGTIASSHVLLAALWVEFVE